MNIREDIYDLLATLPYAVFQTRIDPFQNPTIKPGVSVQLKRSSKELIADGATFRTTDEVMVVITLAQQKLYDAALDAVVEMILSTLLTNAAFVRQFENISEVNVEYDYEAVGETNKASAIITFSLSYVEKFDPNITAILETLHLSYDFITPAADPNLQYPGPDSRIECTQIITTQ
jgi:hypothetical protein